MKKFKLHVMVIFLSMGVSLTTSSQQSVDCVSCKMDLIFGDEYCWYVTDLNQSFCSYVKPYSWVIPSCSGTNINPCEVE